MNQKRVSWKSLLGDYFKTAKKIVVTDPFVRLPHQVSNFIELIQAIQDSSIHAEELVIIPKQRSHPGEWLLCIGKGDWIILRSGSRRIP